jgi:hypothetical protein
VDITPLTEPEAVSIEGRGWKTDLGLSGSRILDSSINGLISGTPKTSGNSEAAQDPSQDVLVLRSLSKEPGLKQRVKVCVGGFVWNSSDRGEARTEQKQDQQIPMVQLVKCEEVPLQRTIRYANNSFGLPKN